MPMIIELVVAMLACARIGALHSIVVGIFIQQKHLLDYSLEGYELLTEIRAIVCGLQIQMYSK